MPNPMLNERAFEKAGNVAVLDRPAQTPPPAGVAPTPGSFGVTAPPWADPNVRTMTVGGTCSAAAVMLVVLALGAVVGWGRVTEQTVTEVNGLRTVQAHLSSPGWVIGALILAFVLAIGTAFVARAARYTAIPYSLCEGFVLGAVSHLVDSQSKGVALQAVVATCGVFAVMLLLYGLRILRATPKFVKGVMAATFGIAAIYLVGLISSAFGHDLGFWSSTSTVSIGFSLVVVVIASLRLIIDFDLIERGSTSGAPTYMEWYAAFGLVVSLVWLYIELLRLLSKLQRR